MFHHVKSLASKARHEAQVAQGLVEYGLILALVAVVAIIGLIVLGPVVRDLLSQLGTSI